MLVPSAAQRQCDVHARRPWRFDAGDPMCQGSFDTTVLSNVAHARRSELLQAALGAAASTTPTVMTVLHTGEARNLVPARRLASLFSDTGHTIIHETTD